MIRLSLLLVAFGLLVSPTAHAVPVAQAHRTQHSSACRWPSVHMKFARVRWSGHSRVVRHHDPAGTSHAAHGR